MGTSQKYWPMKLMENWKPSNKDKDEIKRDQGSRFVKVV